MYMREVRMIDRGPNENYGSGETVHVDDERARLLIEGEHAEDAKKAKRPKRKKKGVTSG